jgi:hypothetical protein
MPAVTYNKNGTITTAGGLTVGTATPNAGAIPGVGQDPYSLGGASSTAGPANSLESAGVIDKNQSVPFGPYDFGKGKSTNPGNLLDSGKGKTYAESTPLLKKTGNKWGINDGVGPKGGKTSTIAKEASAVDAAKKAKKDQGADTDHPTAASQDKGKKYPRCYYGSGSFSHWSNIKESTAVYRNVKNDGSAYQPERYCGYGCWSFRWCTRKFSRTVRYW